MRMCRPTHRYQICPSEIKMIEIKVGFPNRAKASKKIPYGKKCKIKVLVKYNWYTVNLYIMHNDNDAL